MSRMCRRTGELRRPQIGDYWIGPYTSAVRQGQCDYRREICEMVAEGELGLDKPKDFASWDDYFLAVQTAAL